MVTNRLNLVVGFLGALVGLLHLVDASGRNVRKFWTLKVVC